MVGVYQTDDDAEAGHGRRTQPETSPAKKPPRTAAEVQASVDEAYMNAPKEYRDAADKMRKTLESGLEEPVYELHRELNQNQEFYIAVSALLLPAERERWKEVHARVAKRSRAIRPCSRTASPCGCHEGHRTRQARASPRVSIHDRRAGRRA